jgi:hypothetical protein
MQYLLTIYSDESWFGTASPQELGELMEAYGRFTEEVKAAGAFVGGEGLQPTATATTVRVRDGETLFTDGPFAETREQLAGFYLLECADLDEATKWAAKIPDAKRGSIEVRPVMDYEAAGAPSANGHESAQA